MNGAKRMERCHKSRKQNIPDPRINRTFQIQHLAISIREIQNRDPGSDMNSDQEGKNRKDQDSVQSNVIAQEGGQI